MVQTVILCGGLGTRLGGPSSKIPKSMTNIAGKPFLHYQLELLKRNNIANILLCLGHQGHQIEDYFGNGEDYGLSLSYVYDGESLLGTGGSVKNASPYLEDSFILIYGDSYVDIDYRMIHRAFLDGNLESLMVIYKNKDMFDTSNVEAKKAKIKKYSKKTRTPYMKFIDSGVNVFFKRIFLNHNHEGYFELSDLQEKLVDSGLVQAYETKTRFYHIGNAPSLSEFEEMIRKNDNN